MRKATSERNTMLHQQEHHNGDDLNQTRDDVQDAE